MFYILKFSTFFEVALTLYRKLRYNLSIMKYGVINMLLSKNEIGKLVKEARKYKSKKIGQKYTQIMLGRDIKSSQGYIGDIESGRTYPTYKVLIKIAEACEVPLSFFDSITDTYSEIAATTSYNNKIYEKSSDEFKVAESVSNYSEITDVKQAMELILSQPGLMLNGKMLSDESKIALANAIKMGLAYAEKMQGKEKKDK